MKTAIKVAFCSFLLLCSACASSGGPKYADVPVQVEPGKASVVVYRWSSLKGAAWTHRVFLDGQHVADLRSGEFTRFFVEPGVHEISTGTMSHPKVLVANVEALAGNSSFVEDHPGYNLYTPDRLMVVDQARAEKNLRSGYVYHAPIGSGQ
ncbi:MAG: hypothetical protein U1F20_00965 [Lysobacterales bacterium]